MASRAAAVAGVSAATLAGKRTSAERAGSHLGLRRRALLQLHDDSPMFGISRQTRTIFRITNTE